MFQCFKSQVSEKDIFKAFVLSTDFLFRGYFNMLSPRTLILNLPFSRPRKMSCQTREKIIQLFFWVYLARCFRFNVTELISPHVLHLRFSTKPERPVARKHSIVLKVDQPNVTQWHVNPITSSTVLWFDKRSSCYICLSNLKVFCMYVGLLWELWGLYTWRGRGGPSMWRPFEAFIDVSQYPLPDLMLNITQSLTDWFENSI